MRHLGHRKLLLTFGQEGKQALVIGARTGEVLQRLRATKSMLIGTTHRFPGRS